MVWPEAERLEKLPELVTASCPETLALPVKAGLCGKSDDTICRKLGVVVTALPDEPAQNVPEPCATTETPSVPVVVTGEPETPKIGGTASATLVTVPVPVSVLQTG